MMHKHPGIFEAIESFPESLEIPVLYEGKPRILSDFCFWKGRNITHCYLKGGNGKRISLKKLKLLS